MIFSLERSLKLIQKMVANIINNDKALSLVEIISRLKIGFLANYDKINCSIPISLKEELKKYWEQDLEMWNDGWTHDDIAFRYYNILQEYLLKNDVRIFHV